MLRSLRSARIAYAAAAVASLPPTAPDHVILLSGWRSLASVVSSAQRYSTCQLNSIDKAWSVNGSGQGPSVARGHIATRLCRYTPPPKKQSLKIIFCTNCSLYVYSLLKTTELHLATLQRIRHFALFPFCYVFKKIILSVSFILLGIKGHY